MYTYISNIQLVGICGHLIIQFVGMYIHTYIHVYICLHLKWYKTENNLNETEDNFEKEITTRVKSFQRG